MEKKQWHRKHRKFLSFFWIFFALAACKSQPPHDALSQKDSPAAPELEIIEPQFTIISIAVVQADLINTRFKLTLRVDNPNAFPLTITSFGYELYGNDRFWASGREKDFPLIPAKNPSEINLDFEMNFINMNRQLLDNIVAMRQVHYRFTGDVEMETGIPELSGFHINFERSGRSEVIRD